MVAVSSGLKQRLVEIGIAAERVRVLRNGVDLALFHPSDRDTARRALGFTRSTLIAVGNLVALKRHSLMIEALAQLRGVELVVVGDGPERGAIETLARELGVTDRVRLLGRMPQDRLPDIYGAADLLLLVSTHEGWPNVLLESMACGTPVVVSDIGGIADIVAAPEAGRILSDVTPSRLATRSATSSPRRRPDPLPGATPSNSTGRARPKGKLRYFRRLASGEPRGNRSCTSPNAPRYGRKHRHSEQHCVPTNARCR